MRAGIFSSHLWQGVGIGLFRPKPSAVRRYSCIDNPFWYALISNAGIELSCPNPSKCNDKAVLTTDSVESKSNFRPKQGKCFYGIPPPCCRMVPLPLTREALAIRRVLTKIVTKQAAEKFYFFICSTSNIIFQTIALPSLSKPPLSKGGGPRFARWWDSKRTYLF